MTRFSFNDLTYEVPEGIEIVVEVSHGEADFNFRLAGSDEDLPMYGGTDENGRRVASWEDLGIVKVKP